MLLRATGENVAVPPYCMYLSFGLFRSICHSREACAREGGVAGTNLDSRFRGNDNKSGSNLYVQLNLNKWRLRREILELKSP
jgi:hypothetical protein